MQLYYVTFPDEETAERISRRMVEERLAACTTRMEARSIYRWQGEVTGEEEVVVLFKTSDAAGSDLADRLAEEHPYDTPCILELAATPNTAYRSYIDEETR